MKRSCHRHTTYKQIYCDMGYGSCPSRTALFVGGRFKNEDMNEERDRENTSHWQADELQGKVGQCFLSDRQGRPQVGFGENHPRRAAVFSPKTLPYRKH